MSQPNRAGAVPGTLALDFDGVLCDGLLEYFQTSWRTYRTYRQIWPTSSSQPPANLEPEFQQLRPVVTSGWEMPVLLRAIIKGYPTADLQQGWATIRDRILVEEDLNQREIGQRLDTMRDRWIAEDLEGWLGLHRFYPGVVPQLQTWLGMGLNLVIITTKESRFVTQLLAQAQVNLPREAIFGKDQQRTKAEILTELRTSVPTPIWFVEDLLPTLDKVKAAPQLRDVRLFLADWGYNLTSDRDRASQDPDIQVISLDQFSQGFNAWC
jgi:phosphoglycolate phosphatase-like HAD superfamily hydrolase